MTLLALPFLFCRRWGEEQGCVGSPSPAHTGVPSPDHTGVFWDVPVSQLRGHFMSLPLDFN